MTNLAILGRSLRTYVIESTYGKHLMEEALNIGQVLTPTSERTIIMVGNVRLSGPTLQNELVKRTISTSLKQSPAKLSVNEISANRGERDVEL